LTRTALTLPALALMLALTMAGCTSAPATPEATAPTAASPTTSATPSPTPTPELLTVESAGPRYLSAVCVSNKEDQEFGAAAMLPDQPLEVLTQAAAEARDASRSGAQILDDPMFVWPETVAADVALVRDSLLGSVGTYNSLAAARNYDELNGITFADVPGTAEAAQRVRLRLNLSADTAAGCDTYTQ
jgi:hypothetical protein